MTGNHLPYHRVGGQLLVRAICYSIALGPISDCREVDVDQCHAGLPSRSEHDSLQDVGEELELILNVFWSEQAAILHAADILGPVDNA